MTSGPPARRRGTDALAGQRARSARARGASARRCGPRGRLHLLGVVDRPGEALDQLIGGVLVAEMNGVDALVEQDWRLLTCVVDETAVSGSAAVSPDMLRFFYGLGIEILEGYGLTETTAPATFNRPGKARFGTVGLPLPGVEIGIADDGEILVKGGNVFAGYYKDPRATHEDLVDGWLKTGDIGELDKDGYLKITDRKKDLFKTSGGKYVAPGAMETQLRSHRGIGQAVVLGDGRPFVAALITLDRDARETRGGIADPGASRLVEQAIADVNRGLSHPEQIKKWKILDADFVVGDELTPSMKVKRKRIAEKYRAEIESLYAEKKTA